MSKSDLDEREDYLVQQQAREVWIESYSQDRFLADGEGEAAESQQPPVQSMTPNSPTPPVSALPPERTP